MKFIQQSTTVFVAGKCENFGSTQLTLLYKTRRTPFFTLCWPLEMFVALFKSFPATLLDFGSLLSQI